MTSPNPQPSTLDQITSKVRKLTASPSENQLSSSDIYSYVNNFYQYDLPEHMRLFNLKTTYTFTTQPLEDRYRLPEQLYQEFVPPLYVAGYQCYYSLSREEFFRIWPAVQFIETADATGNGTVGPYSFTVSNFPVQRRAVLVAGVDVNGYSWNLQDDGGNSTVSDSDTLIGSMQYTANDGTVTDCGTVNYLTGAISVTFPAAIVAGSPIDVQYVAYQPSRPVAGLIFDGYMYLRPIPDSGYQVTVDAFFLPTALLAAGQTGGPTAPVLYEWWQMLAAGAARKVFEDRLDMDSRGKLEPIFQEYMSLAMRRTVMQYSYQRASTIYTDMVQGAIGNFNQRF